MGGLFLRVELFIEGCYHQRLIYSVIFKQRPDIFFAHQGYGQILSIIQRLLCYLFYSDSEETIGHVIHRPGIGRYGHEQTPFSIAVPGFLQQRSLRGNKRFFPFFHDSTGDFYAVHTQTVPILFFHDEATIFGDSNNIHPIRIFQDIVLGNNSSVGKLYFIASGSKPRPLHNILALDDFSFLAHVPIIACTRTLASHKNTLPRGRCVRCRTVAPGNIIPIQQAVSAEKRQIRLWLVPATLSPSAV